MKTVDLDQEVTDAAKETMFALRFRWGCERGVENINDYAAPIQAALKGIEGVTVTRMTARPFGFTWTGSDGGVRHTCINTRPFFYRTFRVS